MSAGDVRATSFGHVADDYDRVRTESPEGAAPPPRRGYRVALPDGVPFENVATASFTFARSMTVGDLVDWLATYGRIITAPGRAARGWPGPAPEALRQRADENGMIDVPARSGCWRADRLAR